MSKIKKINNLKPLHIIIVATVWFGTYLIMSLTQDFGNNEYINSVNSDLYQEGVFEYTPTLEVYGGDLDGHREANVIVDIGYDSNYATRDYYAFTNEYGQLVTVVAKEVILQDDNKEPVNSKGRYYNDEAKVPGTEASDLDEGHIIADSLGGVGNAYNITPQDSYTNRNGEQSDLEEVIRNNNGCEDFVAHIYYDNTGTQIPSGYYYEFYINGRKYTYDFYNN